MANYTQHYQLHQWEPEDDFLRTDFNTDLEKIDTAIKGVETGLQANLDDEADRLDGEVDRLDGAIATAQQTVQNNLNTQVTRLDGAIATAQQTVQNNLNTQVTRLDGAIATAQQTAQNNLNSSISTVNASIQAVQALANSKCTFAWGLYSGDGAANRFISLSFTPSLVVVTNQTGVMTYSSYCYGGIAVTGSPAQGVEIGANGFYVKNQEPYTLCNYINSSSGKANIYLYMAVQ